MELLENLVRGFGTVLAWQPMVAIIAGVALGIAVGAMPGLSPSMGVALLVPFTYALEPELAVVLLTAIYLAANYGGSITAVTINAPGTPASAVTAMDGYPLTLQGRPGMALGVSLIASTAGGLIGSIVLMLCFAPLSRLALSCHPADYFAIALFGLTSVVSIGGKSWAKAGAMALLGLVISTIGIDPLSGVSRFTFGIDDLYAGFSLIPALIGLFALSEVFHQIEQGDFKTVGADQQAVAWPSWTDYWRLRFGILRSSFIGTIVGVFPGAGATIASFVSYDVAKRLSKSPQEFGNGSLEGIASAEAANSGSVGGALVPLLALGIPGSASTAVLIGALMIHDVVPGPQLLTHHENVVRALFASLLLANGFLLILGLMGSRYWVRAASIRKTVLFPLILAVSVVGSFSVRYAMFDVSACLGFGVVGWILRRYAYPVAPIILGMVLGGIAETNFRQATMQDGYNVFWTRKSCLAILLVAAASLGLPWLRSRKAKSRRSST